MAQNLMTEYPSRSAARALLGKRPLAEWGDVARFILSIPKLETQVINGSTPWCDFGAHLLEQTHVMVKALGLGDAETYYFLSTQLHSSREHGLRVL